MMILYIAHADVSGSSSDGVANLYSTLHLHDIVCGATLTASQTHSYTLHQHDDFVALRLLASQTYTCISHRIPLSMSVALRLNLLQLQSRVSRPSLCTVSL